LRKTKVPKVIDPVSSGGVYLTEIDDSNQTQYENKVRYGSSIDNEIKSNVYLTPINGRHYDGEPVVKFNNLTLRILLIRWLVENNIAIMKLKTILISIKYRT
jgi:hypothetical protein